MLDANSLVLDASVALAGMNMQVAAVRAPPARGFAGSLRRVQLDGVTRETTGRLR
jgi:hypothetical protein